jgi:hypothetical protein
MSELIYANGIDARTGRFLLEPVEVDEFASAIVAEPPALPATEYLERWQDAREPQFGLGWEVDPIDLSQAGWAVVYSTNEDEAVKTALGPLIEHRAAQVRDPERFKVLQHLPGETFPAWLGRHGPAPGTVDPTLVPYYVLLVGSPERIPFEFQYLLDVEYAVGRLHFDDVAGYARYARSVVEYETTATPSRAQSTVFFGTKHIGDRATNLSADGLIKPLAFGENGQPTEATKWGYRSKALVGDDTEEKASRGALLDVLEGRSTDVGCPAVLFTATHGLGLKADDPMQRAINGSLLCQDWRGGTPTPEDSLAASDVDRSHVHGLVAFLFACYSAGTPLLDEFPGGLSGTRATIAPSPFVAALPQALLGHPNGGALAVIGHIERAWGYSIASVGRTQLQPYKNALGQILAGRPVGVAMNDFNERYGVLSASIANLLREMSFGVSFPRSTIVSAWIERTDAQDFVLLGDPAVRLHPPQTT